ncbi:MAG: hypothetical protein B6242_02465 [Anaerolineaceae bacterium 4572_78]|nr:MAG: hypothetical protein B6242_02465 [Anaerolineaceae bacterium 4572_78]
MTSPTKPHDSECKREFLLLLILFMSFRFLTLLQLRPGGFIRDWSDFDTYLGIASLSDYGLYPFLNFWLEWPPPIAWLIVGCYKLSLLLPMWEDHRFWFITIIGFVFLIFEIGNFILIYLLAQKIIPQHDKRLTALWLYAGLFPPVYAMLGFFDGAALFFILLSLHLIISDKPYKAAVAGAIGFTVKLTPILTVGVATRYLADKCMKEGQLFRKVALLKNIIIAWTKYICIFIITVFIIIAPFAMIAPEWLYAFVRVVTGRSSWETIWAIMEGYYGFGQVAGNRLDPFETQFAIYPSSLPWDFISIGFAMIYGFFFFRRADYNCPRSLVAFMGMTITLFLLYSKGYSPQFVVYVLPFIILLFPNLIGVGYALALTILNLFEQPIFFVMLPNETWLLTTIVIVRSLIWIVLSFEFFNQTEISFANPMKLLTRFRYTLATVFIIGLLFVIPMCFSAYHRVQRDVHQHLDLITFLETQATKQRLNLVFTEQILYQELYPFLHDDYRLQLAGGNILYPIEPTRNIRQVKKPVLLHDSVLLFSTGEHGKVIQNEFDKSRHVIVRYEWQHEHQSFGFVNMGTMTLYAPDKSIFPAKSIAYSDNGIELISYHHHMTESMVDVFLFWQATQSQTNTYTVFTQILSEDGKFISGHDGLPANSSQPTTDWATHTIVSDRHAIFLANDLPPGTYRLITGMYDVNGNRLSFHDEAGQIFIDGAIELSIR